MSLVLGVKAHYTDIHHAIGLSDAIELHEDYSSITGDGLMRQTAALGIFGQSKIRALSIHAPIYKPAGDFDLNNREDDDIVRRTLALGDNLLQYISPIVFVFHAEGETFNFRNPTDKANAIENLAMKANGLAAEGRLITVENTGNWTGAKVFARFDDFPIFFDHAEKNIGMTLDICHMFMEYGQEGYRVLDDFVKSYGDHIYNFHISDVRLSDPLKSEGTQIGEGDVDFRRVFESLSSIRSTKDIMVIPEIRYGYVDGYAGFNTAMKRLKTFGLD